MIKKKKGTNIKTSTMRQKKINNKNKQNDDVIK